MKNVLFSVVVDHLLAMNEEIPFLQSFGTAILSKAKVVAHTTDPELGNLFTLRVHFVLPFLITQYVFTNNVKGDGIIKLINREVNYIDFQVNWIAGFSVATQYDAALVGI